MPELVQQEKQEEESSQQNQEKQVIDVQKDSQSELDIQSQEVDEGLEINLEETTVTQRVEKFVEAGEEKKLVELDEDTDSRSFTLTPPGDRYSGMIHPMANVETTEHVEVDFNPAMQRWRMFSRVLNPEAEVKQVSFPQVPEIEEEAQEQKQVETPQEPELDEVEQILDSSLELPEPEESLEENYSEDEEYEYEEEQEEEANIGKPLDTERIDEQLEDEDDYVNLVLDVPASITVDETEAESFDVSGYELSALIEEQEDSPLTELLEYVDSSGLEEFSMLSDNLMLAEYLPEETEDGIHQRLVYRVEEEVAGSTVKGVAEYLSENAPVQVSVEEQSFYSPEEFEMNGELKEPGEYTVHGFDIEDMDDSMTEFRVNNELAEDSIEHVEVETGDYVDFVEAEVYSGHE